MDLHLDRLEFASNSEYQNWSKYYDTLLEAFYIPRLSQQSYRFNEVEFPWLGSLKNNWKSVYTDHFLVTDQFNERSTVGRDITDTYWVEDVYYNIARCIYHNTMMERGEDDATIRQYLLDSKRSQWKPFSMQWLVGAIEADDKETFNYCLKKIRQVTWGNVPGQRKATDMATW